VKEKIWSKDWFAALAFAIVFSALAYGVMSTSFQSLERYTYDLGVKAHVRTPSDKIAVVAIDDESIRNLGRWPWPRSLQAKLVDKLHEGGAKVIGNTAFYFEAEQSGSTAALTEALDTINKSALSQQIPVEIETFGAMLDSSAQTPAVAPIAKAYKQSTLFKDYKNLLSELTSRLDTAIKSGGSPDAVLAAAQTSQGKVVLPMAFVIGRPQGNPDQPLPDYVRKNVLTNIEDRVDAKGDGALPLPTISALFPISSLGQTATAIGYLNDTLDVDGAVRFQPLVLIHFDELYPSFALMVAAQSLNLKPKDIEVQLGEGVKLGGLDIKTTSALRMYTQFYGDRDGKPAFPVDSAYDVIAGKIPVSKYKDKIVLIGATATGLGNAYPTPISASMPPVIAIAHSVSSILQQDFFTRPVWAGLLENGLFVLLVVYLGWIMPKLKTGFAAGLTAAIIGALLVSQTMIMASEAIWFKFTIAAVFLALGHGFMLLKRFNITEKLKLSSEAEGAESNKMLGLAFQGQGQLDMAFEKFRRVKPIDDKLLDLLYNLALDFERKRQFNKAENVFKYIAEYNKDFRDVQSKVNRAKQLSETVILGGGSSHPGGGTLIMDATQKIEKPMLGRYQVDKELGKGAMGIVYMGKDPKIGRTVAIKTMALSQEFEPGELDDVKSRFFREAETAGRLSHPNIVQIFDAGEEHDLAYIAMEFIKGQDLTKHIKSNTLLPVNEVLKFVADAADALDYAHGNGVVHRDIKPANMMLVEATQTIKLMDFGIARLSDSSKTKTGMVLGTPSYMSPEQLSGKKVDGRTDLFSLGVTLYQLLTGSLPFHGESMATLMFKIANEPHAVANIIRPDLPESINTIIDRALKKNPDERYQRGSEMSRDIRAVIAGG
jgi:CHASE2 domain-containing sensor protein/predicted Ser/Thr protein kinase